jgi:hypothetical protein
VPTAVSQLLSSTPREITWPLLLPLLLPLLVLRAASQVPPKFLFSMIAGKLLLHPLAGMALVLGALQLHLLPQGLDPLIPLVMMMVWATPTAVLVHSLATMLRVSRNLSLPCVCFVCKVALVVWAVCSDGDRVCWGHCSCSCCPRAWVH